MYEITRKNKAWAVNVAISPLFFSKGQFMFVTSESRERPGHTDLRVSAHGERFVIAEFDLGPGFKRSYVRDTNDTSLGGSAAAADDELIHIDYHIIDVTEDGEIMVVVNHGAVLSNLYTSTRITPHEVKNMQICKIHKLPDFWGTKFPNMFNVPKL